MTQDEDQDALAAEYVLGTLDRAEREQAEALLVADPAFAVLVRGWERRLGELQAMVDPIEPPPHIFEQIRSRIAAEGPPLAQSSTQPPAAAAPTETASNVVSLTQRVKRWRGVAAASTALAASLALFVAVRELAPGLLPPGLLPQTTDKAPGRFVAVLQQSASAPAFLLTVDVESKTFTVRRVGAEPQAGRSYELWLVSDQFPQPRSLGVIGSGTFTSRPTLAGFDPQTINRATYAVSLEPEGGSPTGVPTGPVLYVGNLIEATP